MGVCKGAVPPVVVGGGPDAEAAAVNCEEGREGFWGGLVVGRGEEDAAGVSAALWASKRRSREKGDGSRRLT